MRAITIAAVLSACGSSGAGADAEEVVDCSMVTGTDTFTVGLAKPGVNGAVDFKLMSIDPAPAVRGNNTWVVHLTTIASNAPMDGASITATPFMPAHQHGSPITAAVTATGTAGEYSISPINLWMPGVWQTTLTVTNGTADRAVFSFCVN